MPRWRTLSSGCVHCTLVHRHWIWIRGREHSAILRPVSAYQEEKACRGSTVFFLCRLTLGPSQLNPSCDVQPPRKQLAHNHSALRFHDRSQAHTLYVSGAYVTKYNGRGWPYYFFFFPHCLFYGRKGIEGLMCSLASSPAHAPAHKFIGWKFLAGLHRDGE